MKSGISSNVSVPMIFLLVLAVWWLASCSPGDLVTQPESTLVGAKIVPADRLIEMRLIRDGEPDPRMFMVGIATDDGDTLCCWYDERLALKSWHERSRIIRDPWPDTMAQ